MDEKEFGKLTGEQVEQFSPFVKTMFEEFDQLRVELSSNEISPNRLDEIASPWSMWYSLSMVELLSLWAWSFRFDKIIRSIAKKADPQEVALKFMKAIENGKVKDRDPRLPFKWKGDADSRDKLILSYGVSLNLALMHNATAIGLYGLPMYDLLGQAKSGNREKLLEAIVVDPTVLSSEVGSKILASAALIDDRSFLELISKAITKTKPRPPQERIRATRYVLSAIYQSGKSVKATKQSVRALILDKLGIYEERDDPDAALQKLMTRQFKAWRT